MEKAKLTDSKYIPFYIKYKMEYIYVSQRTKENLKLSKLPSTHILQTYNIIKSLKRKGEKRWGIFLFDKNQNEIIGVCEVISKKENSTKLLLISFVFIDNEYRGKKQCYELVKQTILKHEKNEKSLIKVVIAGGEPILRCLIKVFRDLNYTIKKYKSDTEENIKNLKKITFEEAIKIEKKNKELDIWQTLFFVK